MATNGKSLCERCTLAAEVIVHERDPSSPSGWRWANYCDEHAPPEDVPADR
jgi:hypothetical protein